MRSCGGGGLVMGLVCLLERRGDDNRIVSPAREDTRRKCHLQPGRVLAKNLTPPWTDSLQNWENCCLSCPVCGTGHSGSGKLRRSLRTRLKCLEEQRARPAMTTGHSWAAYTALHTCLHQETHKDTERCPASPRLETT